MANERIDIDLNLNAAGYIADAGRAAKATGDIAAAGRQVDEAGKGATSSIKGFIAANAGAIKTAGAAFAVREIKDFVGSAIDSFSKLEESSNAVRVQFGSGADAILDFAKTSASSVGLASSEFQQLSTVTGALFSGFIKDSDQVAAETIKLTQRATDMASVFDTDVGDALFALQAAIRGETEPIRRFGVLLDDASIRAKAVALGLAETAGSADLAAKRQAALALIYEQTNKVQGDFANTSESIANVQRKLAAEFENTKARVGEALAPAFATLLDAGMDLLPAIEALVPAIANLAGGFASLIAVGAPVIGFLADTASRVGSIFSAIAAGDADAIRFRKAIEEISGAQKDGSDQAAAFANSLLFLATEGELTTDKLEELAGMTEFVGDQQAVALQEVLRLAEARGADRASVEALEKAYAKEVLALDLTVERRKELLDQLGLEDSESQAVRDAYHALERQRRKDGEAAFYQTDAGKALKDQLDRERDANELYRFSEERKTGAVDESTAAFYEQRDAIRASASALAEAANPLLGHIAATDRVREATERLTEVQENAESTTHDVQQAQLDLIKAQLELEGSAEALSGKLDIGSEALRLLGEQAGLSAEDITALIGLYDDFPTRVEVEIAQRYTTQGTPVVRGPISVGVQSDIGTFTPTGTTSSQLAGARAEGGPVTADDAFLVGEEGPEIFVPDTPGQIIPADVTTSIMGAAKPRTPVPGLVELSVGVPPDRPNIRQVATRGQGEPTQTSEGALIRPDTPGTPPAAPRRSLAAMLTPPGIPPTSLHTASTSMSSNLSQSFTQARIGGGNTYQIHLESRNASSYDDVQLALGMMGVTEQIENAGYSTLR